MKTFSPMDRNFASFQEAEKRLEDRRQTLDLRDPANASAFMESYHELELSVRAMDLTLRSRHGLLKKVMNEMK